MTASSSRDVQVWIGSLDDVDLAAADGVFSPAERARAERLLSPRSRQRFLARRWLARSLLAQATGLDPGELVLESRCMHCDRLHPVSPLGAAPAPTWWSASSSGDLAAIAISPWRVGVDVESLDRGLGWERIARRFYNDAERRRVGRSLPRFLELWTMKEAYLKALGVGLSGGLHSLDCSTFVEGGGPWRASAAHPDWRFAQLHPQPGFAAAVAVEGSPRGLAVDRATLPMSA